MHGGHIDLGEDTLFGGKVIGDLGLPVQPLELDGIPEVIITKSLIWEFDFGGALPDGTEIFHILFVILTTTEATSNGPHTRKDKECLIGLLEVILFEVWILDGLVELQQQRIQDHTNGHNLSDVNHGHNQSDLTAVTDFLVGLEVGLEATEEDTLAGVIEDR